MGRQSPSKRIGPGNRTVTEVRPENRRTPKYNKLLSPFHKGRERSGDISHHLETLKKKVGPVAILFGFSLFLRFLGLSYPDSVVFDEVHFGKFITSYTYSGQNFFDIHPPHAKLLIAGAAKLLGYHNAFSFERIGQPFGEASPFALRWLTALVGSLLPLVFYFLVRQLAGSRPIAMLGGIAVLLEGSFIVQSRVIGLDMYLLVASLLSISFFLVAMKRTTRKRYFWLLGSGAMAGMAVGTKFTGLAIPSLLGLILLKPFLFKRSLGNLWFFFKHMFVVLLAAAAVYLIGWQAHFSLLPFPGPGDRFYRNTGDFTKDLSVLHSKMFSSNMGINKGHPNASPWNEWPIMKKAIYYWAGPDKRAIYLIGNPVVWWGSIFFFVAILGILVLGRITTLNVLPSRPMSGTILWVPIAGFFISYLPLVFISRPLFLYHYFTPLLFSILTILLWLDQAEWVVSSRFSKQRKSYFVILGALILGFIFMMPAYYGVRFPDLIHNRVLSVVNFFL